MLPIIWTLFAVLAVGGFLMIAAYWLDVQDRPGALHKLSAIDAANVFIFHMRIVSEPLVGSTSFP